MSNYMKQFTLTLVSVMGQPETTYSWGKYNCMAGLQFNNFGLNCFTTSILITYIFFLGYISKQVESLDQTFYGRKIIIIIYQIVEDVDDDDVEDDERFLSSLRKRFWVGHRVVHTARTVNAKYSPTVISRVQSSPTHAALTYPNSFHN